MSRRRKPTTSSQVAVPLAGSKGEFPARPPRAQPAPDRGHGPAWPARAMEAVWLATAALSPSLVNPAGLRVFEAEKVALLRSAALVLVALWIIVGLSAISPRRHEDTKASNRRQANSEGQGQGVEPASRFSPVAFRFFVSWCLGGFRRLFGSTPLAYPVLALMAAYLVAALLSEVPRVSLLGSYRRQLGAGTYLAYGVIFFAVATHLRTPAQAGRLLAAVALGSAPPALVGLLQYLRPADLGWITGLLEPNQRIVGTLGQPTYLAGYLAMALPASLHLLMSARSPGRRLLLGSLIALQVAVLVLTESRAAWLGAAAGAAILGLASRAPGERVGILRSRRLQMALVVALLALALANLPGTPVQQAARQIPYLGRLATLAEFQAGTGRVRALIWGRVPALVAERPLLGHGPEMMAYAFERRYPPELARLESYSAVVDRAHNWLLEAMVSTGLLGTAAQLALLWSVLAAYPRISTHHFALAGLGAWLVDQMAGIPSSITSLLFWLYLGLASAGLRVGQPRRYEDTKMVSRGIFVSSGLRGYRLAIASAVAVAAAAAVLWIGVMSVVADVAAARGSALLEAGRWREAFEGYRAAASTYPEAEYLLLMGQAATRAIERSRGGDATVWLQRGEDALRQAESADPLRWDVAMARGKLHQAASDLPGGGSERERALASYARAVALAPGRVAVRDAHASALMDLGRYEEAVARLQESLALDPGFAPTHGYLGDSYLALGRREEALAAFRRGVELDPKSAPLRNGLARAYARIGDAARDNSGTPY